MTTPGQQLTPGDEENDPVFGVPEGAYVGDASSPDAIHDLNTLTEDGAKARMQAGVAPSFAAQRDGVWGFFSLITGVVQGVVDTVVGVVDAIVGGIHAIAASIGSLFGFSSRDMAAVDQARVDGENAIVENMSDSLEHLDEIQRFGGAYMGYETFSIWEGELGIRVLPLSDPVPLAAGVGWIPPNWPLTHSALHQYGNSESQTRLPRGSGQLEILESGLWMIFFQGSFRQGVAYEHRPINMWCHVTPASSPWLPQGPPGLIASGDPIPGEQMARHRVTGESSRISQSDIAAFGRAAAYSTSEQVAVGGGNTLFGMIYAHLETGGWKVNMSDMSFEKFGGAASTFVIAQKVNSETLRQDIDQLKDDIAAALPGENVDMLLDEASIAAMVAEAEGIHVDDVIVPTEPPEPDDE